MKIAQISPLTESVPPRFYGGTERIVSYLSEELVALGHQVTLFASGDSITAAKLVPCVPHALRLDATVRDPLPYQLLMLDRVRRMSEEFDILHFHIDQSHFPVFRPLAVRTVTTLHGRQDLPDLVPLYLGFDDMPLVSISNDQRRPVQDANFVATIYHGIPTKLQHPVGGRVGDYVAFLGRISPEKRPDRAISIARALALPLKIAAKGRPRRRSLFPKPDRAPAARSRRRVHRRNQRASEDALPRRGRGTVVSGRLAGTIRPLDYRSDGLRHAGPGFPPRLGARNH
jgi:glycosyltransferase involved in cell wall biosynthesis